MIDCFGLTDTGCVRPNNEDFFLTAPDLGLCVLADGMGGARAGETASQLAAETVAEAVRQAAPRNSRALLEGMQQANQKVLTLSKTDAALEGMGTTLVVALDQGEELVVASVGDSRAYALEPGCLRPVTQDQSWVNDVGRLMGLDEEALRTHPLRHVLTMAIGSGAQLTVNCYTLAWPKGSILLLSSDGLHGVVSAERIESILRDGSPNGLEEKCRALIGAAREAGGPDNITAVLLRRSG